MLCRLDDLWLFSSPAEQWERLASLDVGGTIQTPHDWLLNLALADPRFASGSWPSGRWGHSATAVPAGLNQSVTRSLVVFGGRGEGSTVLSDVWSFSFVTMSWSALSPSGTAPSGRYLHSAVLLGEMIYIFVRPQTRADLCLSCV